MIKEQAKVVRIEGDVAYFEIERSQSCSLCGTTRGCGVSLWGSLFGRRRGIFSSSNTMQLNVGDPVVIYFEERTLLSAAMTAYLLPLLLIGIGALAGTTVGISPAGSDFYAATGAAVGLFLGLWVVKKFSTTTKQTLSIMRLNDINNIRQCLR